MATPRARPYVEYNTFCPGQPSLHQRKYGKSKRFRGRAHEFVSNSWYYACKEADINMRRRGAYGPAKESLGVRFGRFRRDLPSEGSRWLACEDIGIPRALLRRRTINRLQHRAKLDGFDPAVVRGKCARFGKRAWEITKHVCVERPWSLADTHRHLSIRPPWTEDVSPTHLLRFIMRAIGDMRPVRDDEIGIQMPVHGAIAQAFLSHLHRLPRSWGLTRLKEYDENGVEIPDTETSEGDVPFITIVVPDTKMIPHLMYYIYHQDQETLLLQLCGDYAQSLVNNLFLTNQCNEFLDVRIEELRQSEKIAKEVSKDDLANGLHDLYSLHELADFFGLSDDRFWNTLDVAHRVLLDAAGLKKTWELRAEGHPQQEQKEAEEKLQEENEAEERIVEDMLFEDDIEEMEVEDMLLDDEEESVLENAYEVFYHCSQP